MIKRLKWNEIDDLDKWHKRGYKVMCDIKLWDIPNTMKATCESCRKRGFDYISLRKDAGKTVYIEDLKTGG